MRKNGADTIKAMRAALKRAEKITYTVTTSTYDPYNIEGKK